MRKEGFDPELQELYPFEQYTLLLLEEGCGVFEVDFMSYSFHAPKAIFLSPGQYFRLLAGTFRLATVIFDSAYVNRFSNSRYLFKHLISLGHLDLGVFQAENPNLLDLDYAIRFWQRLNPFRATEDEVDTLFDIKEIIDQQYRERINIQNIAEFIQQRPGRIRNLTRLKLQTTVKNLQIRKSILEARRKVVFSDATIKEIAYQTGFRDPAYFHNFFKQHSGYSPSEFRNNYPLEYRQGWLEELYNLINRYFTSQHNMAFYAGKLHVSEKTLQRKLQGTLGLHFSDLMREKLMEEAKKRLKDSQKVSRISAALGFEEISHFSNYFRKNSGCRPSEFMEKS